MDILSFLRGAHIGGGAIALLSMWIPMVVPKGGRLHRRAGWVYVIATGVVVVSAWAVCMLRLFDAEPANDKVALFLAFIALLTANASITGVRAVRFKARTGPHRNAVEFGNSWLLLAASIAFAIGVAREPVFLVFSALAAFRALDQLRYWRKPPSSPMAWWYEHMTNMLTSAIATATAFVVVNAKTLDVPRFAFAIWIGPGVIGVVGLVLWVRRYEREFGDR